MLTTLDTNVLYQSLYSNTGASNFIIQQVKGRKIQMALSVPVFYEYEAVLSRKSSLNNFELDKEDIDKFLRYIAYIGKVYDPHYLYRPNLKDESDNMFVELAVASQSDYLITNNIKDYKNSELKFDRLRIITPSEFVKIWRKKYA
jgi:putative PIN family toxin of toxin-antitoxin system